MSRAKRLGGQGNRWPALTGDLGASRSLAKVLGDLQGGVRRESLPVRVRSAGEAVSRDASTTRHHRNRRMASPSSPASPPDVSLALVARPSPVELQAAYDATFPRVQYKPNRHLVGPSLAVVAVGLWRPDFNAEQGESLRGPCCATEDFGINLYDKGWCRCAITGLP